jgi:hypothetical protein
MISIPLFLKREEREEKEEMYAYASKRQCCLSRREEEEAEAREEEAATRGRLLFLSLNMMPCALSKFSKQTVIDGSGLFDLDEENALLVIRNPLGLLQVTDYLAEASKVERTSSRSAFGHMKPRREICYSPSGMPYVYSRVKHPTTRYPEHVKAILPVFERAIDNLLEAHGKPRRPYRRLSSGVDICYDASFERGGSIAAHRDDEEEWGMVLIFSLGQTRYLRIRGQSWTNVAMTHNSLVVMYGPSFQTRYTHQVDKLQKNEIVGTRLSLNVRYGQVHPLAELF